MNPIWTGPRQTTITFQLGEISLKNLQQVLNGGPL